MKYPYTIQKSLYQKRNRITTLEKEIVQLEEQLKMYRKQGKEYKMDLSKHHKNIRDMMIKSFGVSKEDILSDNRIQEFRYVRYTMYAIFRNVFNMTCTSIGRIMNKNYTSVLYGIKQFDMIASDYPFYFKQYNELKFTLGQKFLTPRQNVSKS